MVKTRGPGVSISPGLESVPQVRRSAGPHFTRAHRVVTDRQNSHS